MPSDPPATDPRVSDSRHITVSFSARGLLVVGAALVLGWAFVTAASAIFVIAVSFFLALVLDPPVTSLVKRTGMSRGRAATLMVLGLVLAGLLITLALLIPLLRELKDLVQSLHARVDVGAEAQNHAADISATVPDTLSAFVGLAGNVFGFFFLIFELIFLTLFLLCDLPQFSDSIEGMLY